MRGFTSASKAGFTRPPCDATLTRYGTLHLGQLAGGAPFGNGLNDGAAAAGTLVFAAPLTAGVVPVSVPLGTAIAGHGRCFRQCGQRVSDGLAAHWQREHFRLCIPVMWRSLARDSPRDSPT